MPLALSGHCALRSEELMYVIGSNFLYSDYLEVLLLNVTSSSWQILPCSVKESRPIARQDFACSFSVDKAQIFISGGKTQSSRDSSSSDFYAFSLQSQSWWKLPNSLESRSGHEMTLYRNYTTILGGVCSENQTSLSSMESFIDGSWTTLEETITQRKNFKVTQVPSSYFGA